MAVKITGREFQLLRHLIERLSGILLADEKAYLMESRLAPLLQPHGCRSFGDLYLKATREGARGRVSAAILEAITTNETSWFRIPDAFQALRDPVLRNYYREIRTGARDRVTIWSAASSTGQEPYSIAMAALEFYRTMGGERACLEQIKILATDVSHVSIAAAETGWYQELAVQRGVPAEYLDRYFRKEKNGWVIRDTVRELVTFKQVNLREPFVSLGLFDVVFLRNVTIYFSESFKRELFPRVTRVLRPGGYLFLGTGEVATRYARDIQTVPGNGVVYYRYAP